MTHDRIYEVEVAVPPQKVWEALTEPHTVRRYYYGTSPRTTWEVGSPIEFVDDDGEVQLEGVVLAFEPPVLLAHTFIATWYGGRDDQGSLNWEVTATDAGSRVTLVHRGAQAASREGSETADGSRHIVDALKALLERTPDIAQSVVVDAPLERVWDAIADATAFGTWFGAEFDGPFEVGATVTGRIVPTAIDPEVAAAQEPHRGAPMSLDVVALEPMRRAAFRWQPVSDSEVRTAVELLLEPVDGGIRVTMTEDGFDELPEELRDPARDGNDGGWAAQTRLLAGYLARAA